MSPSIVNYRNFLRAWLLLATLIILLIVASASAQSDAANCVNGVAAGYTCENINLVGHMSIAELGGDVDAGILGSDLWGWTSPTTEREYVIVGLRNATSFIDISDPLNPILLGKLPAHVDGMSDYRDIKVYDNHAFIVADTPYTDHGMQVFDLTQLDNVASPPQTFAESAHYDGIGFGHNMWINEATGFAYIFRTDTCSAATHVVDINDPLNPVMASADGCIILNGADSDAECVVYNGPDADYVGKEICFTGSDDTAGIIDVSDKANPAILADFTYPDIRRAHQGALTEDMRYWIISDTMDEMMLGINTRTVIIDVSDLDNPTYVRSHTHETTARDHNVYITGDTALMTNWRAGFRVMDMSDFADWREIAYFDTYPADDGVAVKSGAWSHYDWFDSKVIAVSDVESGLFLLRIAFEPTDVSVADVVGVLQAGQAPLAMALIGLGAAVGLGAVYRTRQN